MQNKLLLSHDNNYSKRQTHTKSTGVTEPTTREQRGKEIHVQKLPGFVVI